MSRRRSGRRGQRRRSVSAAQSSPQAPLAQPVRLRDRALTAIPPAAVVVGAAALYLATIAPSITTAAGSADSGELISVAAVLGVAHPPGYGLYLVLARAALEALRFLGEPALRTNV